MAGWIAGRWDRLTVGTARHGEPGVGIVVVNVDRQVAADPSAREPRAWPQGHRTGVQLRLGHGWSSAACSPALIPGCLADRHVVDEVRFGKVARSSRLWESRPHRALSAAECPGATGEPSRPPRRPEVPGNPAAA